VTQQKGRSGSKNGPSTRRRLDRFIKKNRPEILYTYSFSTHAGHPAADTSGYALVDASEELLTRLRKTYPRQLSEHKHHLLVERLKSRSERCWVIADAQGDLCGYCHVALEDTLNARINHKVEVGPSQAYFFDDSVFHQHSGKGLHAFSIARRLEIVASMGVTEGLTTIAKKNAPSIASYGKFDLRPEKTLVHLPLLGRTLSLPRRTRVTR